MCLYFWIVQVEWNVLPLKMKQKKSTNDEVFQLAKKRRQKKTTHLQERGSPLYLCTWLWFCVFFFHWSLYSFVAHTHVCWPNIYFSVFISYINRKKKQNGFHISRYQTYYVRLLGKMQICLQLDVCCIANIFKSLNLMLVQRI